MVEGYEFKFMSEFLEQIIDQSYQKYQKIQEESRVALAKPICRIVPWRNYFKEAQSLT